MKCTPLTKYASDDMKLWRKTSIVAVLAISCTTDFGQTAASKPTGQPYPAHLPYSFSNLVWWSDAELHLQLKKRIPSLGDEMATSTEDEDRICEALTAMLKEKGIDADVMSEAPSPSALRPIPPDLLGVDTDDQFPVSKPSIIFMINRPEIAIGTIKVQANANDAQAAIEEEFQRDEGRPFTEGSLSFSKYEAERSVKRLGYFDVQVLIRRSIPYKQGDRYLVNETVIADTGPKYRIASISADGGPLLAGADLSRYFTVRVGDPATLLPFGRLGAELSAYYEQYGFADVRIVTNPLLDRDHATVSYALNVVTGPVYHLRSLTIEKLSAEQERHVREIFGMKPGDLYRSHAINDLYHAIANDSLLKGYTFGFSPKSDKAAAMVDLTLDFSKEGGEGTVKIE